VSVICYSRERAADVCTAKVFCWPIRYLSSHAIEGRLWAKTRRSRPALNRSGVGGKAVEVVDLSERGQRARLQCNCNVGTTVVLEGEAMVKVPRRPQGRP